MLCPAFRSSALFFKERLKTTSREHTNCELEDAFELFTQIYKFLLHVLKCFRFVFISRSSAFGSSFDNRFHHKLKFFIMILIIMASRTEGICLLAPARKRIFEANWP